MIETAPCNSPECRPTKIDGRDRMSKDGGAGFTTQLEQTETDLEDQTIAIGVSHAPDSDPQTYFGSAQTPPAPDSADAAQTVATETIEDGFESLSSAEDASETTPAKVKAIQGSDLVQTESDLNNAARTLQADTSATEKASKLTSQQVGADNSIHDDVHSEIRLEKTRGAQPSIDQIAATPALPRIEELVAPVSEPDRSFATDTPPSTLSVNATLGIAPSAIASVPINQAVPTAPVIAATPPEVVAIISDALSTIEQQKDRIVVQLDPPELGRVSIDFKFDVQGLQHVTITGETPEAIRQLRMLHFELVQALEQHGLTEQSMTFRHQHNHNDTAGGEAANLPTTGDSLEALEITNSSRKHSPDSILSNGLDIKL